MKNIKYILTLVLLLAMVGCSKETNIDNPKDILDPSQFTLVVEAAEETGLRANLEQIEGTYNFKAYFKPTDKVLLYFVQDDIIYGGQNVEFDSVSEDGKEAFLTITLPEEIDANQPVDIIGYSGINQDSYKGPNIYLSDSEKVIDNLPEEMQENTMALMPASPYLGCLIDAFEAPVIFRMNGVTPAETDLDGQKVRFEHVGSYEVVHFENRTDAALSDPVTLSEPGNFVTKNYVYNSGFNTETRQTEHCYYDLLTGKVVVLTENIGYQAFTPASQKIPAGETGTYVTWVMPRVGLNSVPELTVAMGSYSSVKFSRETIPARNKGMQTGVAYNAFGYYDGENVVATTVDGESRPTSFIKIRTNIPKGETIIVNAYVGYANRETAFIDLNNNGEKDNGEELTESYGDMEYIVDSPIISFEGAFEDLKLGKQQITDVEISPVSTIYGLDLRQNELDAATLNKIIEQLPNRTGVTPDYNRTLKLQISGNPGLEELDENGEAVVINLFDAIEKGWILDVPIVRNDLPQNYIELSDTDTFAFSIDADEEDREDIWIDLNGNGNKDEGEDLLSFGPNSVNLAGSGGLPRLETTQLFIYGNITSLSVTMGNVKSYWGTESKFEYANPKLRHLDLSGQEAMMMAVTGLYPELETLVFSNCPALIFMDKPESGLPFLMDPTSLKVLDLGKSGELLRDYSDPIDVSEMVNLTYLNIQGWQQEEIALEELTKLERLIVSDNAVKSLDITGKPALRYIEAIGNDLSGAEVQKLLDNLPDRTGKSPGRLYIAGNPGTGDGDYPVATAKNWIVDSRSSVSDNPARRPDMEGEDW